MSYTKPTESEFKTYFARDFPFGADISTDILDSDITKAFGVTNITIPEEIFPSQEFYTIGYMYLSAHNLVQTISSSSQGISGRYEWGMNSKSVGSISVSYNIPPNILSNPAYSFLTKTTYGAKYLELIYPFLVGPFSTVEGMTHA